MSNSHADLKAKIDEEPANAGRTDAAVLDWLNETEQGPWVNVQAVDFEIWVARWELAGRLQSVGRETYDNAREDTKTVADDERSASTMLYNQWQRGLGLLSSDADVRKALNKASGDGKVVSIAARDDLLALARPDVQRWVNADWTREPNVGDVNVARRL